MNIVTYKGYCSKFHNFFLLHETAYVTKLFYLYCNSAPNISNSFQNKIILLT